MIIKVKVTPGAREDKVVGMEGDLLKVKLRAPPENGKANQALIEVLAGHFKVHKRSVIIKSGHTERIKLVIIETA